MSIASIKRRPDYCTVCGDIIGLGHSPSCVGGKAHVFPPPRVEFVMPLSGSAVAHLTITGEFDAEDLETLERNFVAAKRALTKAAAPSLTTEHSR